MAQLAALDVRTVDPDVLHEHGERELVGEAGERARTHAVEEVRAQEPARLLQGGRLGVAVDLAEDGRQPVEVGQDGSRLVGPRAAGADGQLRGEDRDRRERQVVERGRVVVDDDAGLGRHRARAPAHDGDRRRSPAVRVAHRGERVLGGAGVGREEHEAARAEGGRVAPGELVAAEGLARQRAQAIDEELAAGHVGQRPSPAHEVHPVELAVRGTPGELHDGRSLLGEERREVRLDPRRGEQLALDRLLDQRVQECHRCPRLRGLGELITLSIRRIWERSHIARRLSTGKFRAPLAPPALESRGPSPPHRSLRAVPPPTPQPTAPGQPGPPRPPPATRRRGERAAVGRDAARPAGRHGRAVACGAGPDRGHGGGRDDPRRRCRERPVRHSSARGRCGCSGRGSR